MKFLLLLSIALAAVADQLTVGASLASAETIVIGPQDDWFAWLSRKQLKPGDQLVLRAGTYSDARRLAIRHRGTEAKPITIRAAENQRVVFQRPDKRQNSFNLEGTQFLHLVGFEITGGAAGIRIGTADGHQPTGVVLRGLHIHHIDGVAVTCNQPGATYRRMVFEGNHIHHTGGHGEAFYLGGNNANAIVADSIIQNNYLHDLKGPSVSQGDGVELKLGSYGNRIVGNVIHDTNYPGIIAYGTRGQPRNVIERNIICRTGDHGIQVAADAIVQNNVVIDAAGCGIYSRTHQGAVPANLKITDNYVVAKRNPAIRIVGDESVAKAAASSIEISKNQLDAGEAQAAIRIQATPVRCEGFNRGQGRLIGPDSLQRCWQEAELAAVQLPVLRDNPAWQFIDRDDLYGPGPKP